MAEACERFGISYDTALQAARVSAAFDSCVRTQELSFEHHRIVANHDQAADLLAWAEETGATVKQLREEKQRRSIAAAPTKNRLELDVENFATQKEVLFSRGKVPKKSF